MLLLSDNDRQYVLEQLRTAPDSVLVDAMLALNAVRDKVVATRKIIENATGSAPVIQAAIEKAAEPTKEVVRKNVSPGPAAIGKIGSNTKDVIFEFLRDDKQPPAKYDDHLKLLWARGEVKYDGKEWYL